MRIPGGTNSKESTCQCKRFESDPWVSPLEKEMTHLNILAWRIPWTEKPGGLSSIGSPIPSPFFKKLGSVCFPSLKPAAFYKVRLL